MSSDTLETNFRPSFDQLEQNLNGHKGNLAHKTREAAMANFERLGVPGRKHEEWKYTSLKAFRAEAIQPIIARPAAQLTQLTGAAADFWSDAKVNKLVFVNGFYDEQLSDILDESLEVGFMEAYMKELPQEVAPYFNQLAKNKDEAFTALNTALASDGACIRIKKGQVVEHPVLLLHIGTELTNETFYQVRHLIIAEENSQARFIEDHRSVNGSALNCNSHMEIFCAKDSHVDLTVIQEGQEGYHYIGTKEIDQRTGSFFGCKTVSIGGELIRNNLNVRFAEERAETDLQGFYFANGSSIIDNHLLIDHAMPRCLSNQLYKGIMSDEGEGVFNGKIFVREDAQQTNAYQSNKNLVLSEKAGINTKPQLEIFADDVKCSHGATSGQLDEQSVFYLMARGIPEKKARNILMHAFGAEVIDAIAIPELSTLLNDRLLAYLEA